MTAVAGELGAEDPFAVIFGTGRGSDRDHPWAFAPVLLGNWFLNTARPTQSYRLEVGITDQTSTHYIVSLGEATGPTSNPGNIQAGHSVHNAGPFAELAEALEAARANERWLAGQIDSWRQPNWSCEQPPSGRRKFTARAFARELNRRRALPAAERHWTVKPSHGFRWN